jgi:rod shape-determining protein MreD
VKKFLLPLLFLFLFLFESIFLQFLPASVLGGPNILVPHFLFVALLFLTIYGSEKHGIIYGIIFGLLFDIVYTEILGVYMFFYPLIAYIVSKIMKAIQVNLMTVSIVSLFGIALLEAAVFEINQLIGFTNMDFVSFLSLRLLPTLILNAIFIIIAAYPLKRQFEKFADFLRAD